MMANFRVQIPEPCPMSMADMVPVQNGYHCARCEKTVVDFRTYSTDEIQAYFKNKNGQRVCGILPSKTGEELPAITVTADHMHQGVSRLFFAALLLVFTHLFIGCGGIIEPQTAQVEPPMLLGAVEMQDIIGEKDTLLSSDTSLHKIIPRAICDKVFGSNSVEMIPEPVVYPTGEIEPIEYPVAGGITYHSMPQFPGGEEALMKYLQKNVHYPEYEKEKGIEGKVYVSFVIVEDGSVQDIKILRSVEGAPNFDTEVLRVIKSMPNWLPGKEGNTTVPTPYHLPIEFRLD